MEISIDDFCEEKSSEIRSVVKNGTPVTITATYFSPAVKQKYQDFLELFLEECNQTDLFNCLSYCIFELLDNASRANAKRIYFQEKKLDIHDSEDYVKGMSTFREDIARCSKHYLESSSSFSMSLLLSCENENLLTVRVSNNTHLTETEFLRIQEKIEKSRKYENMAEALMEVDQTEGSGLGIISVVLMLKRLGLEADCLKYDCNESTTEVTIEMNLDDLFIELE